MPCSWRRWRRIWAQRAGRSSRRGRRRPMMAGWRSARPGWRDKYSRREKMCLAIPAQVVELRDGDNAVVDLAGVRKEISLALVENVAVGDYVIVHVGYALNKLDPAEAEKTLKLFAEMGGVLPEDGPP